VVWAIPPSDAPPVAVFHILGNLPNVVGLSQAKAASTLAALGLPVFVAHTEVPHPCFRARCLPKTHRLVTVLPASARLR
jgi:hypothetical protein